MTLQRVLKRTGIVLSVWSVLNQGLCFFSWVNYVSEMVWASHSHKHTHARTDTHSLFFWAAPPSPFVCENTNERERPLDSAFPPEMIHKSSVLLLQLYVTDRETEPGSGGLQPRAVICIPFVTTSGRGSIHLAIMCDGGWVGERKESLLIGGQDVWGHKREHEKISTTVWNNARARK